MDLEYLQVAIDCKIDDFEKALEDAQSGLGRLADYAKSAGESLTKYVTAPLALLAGASLKTAGDMQALELGFRAVYKGAGDVGEELKKTYEIAKLPGLGLKEAVQGSTRLQAVGFSAEEAGKALRAFGNAVASTGGGKAELDRITVQLGQLAAKGKVLSQDLRPIIEAAPLVASALQNLYGTVDSEDISKKLEAQGLSSKQFVGILTDELGKLPQVAGGLKNSFENFGDSVTKALAKVGTSINQNLHIESLLNSLGDTIGNLADDFANLDPGVQKFILGLAGAVAAVGPILLAIGTLGAAVPYLTAGFAVLGVTSVASLASAGSAVLAFATGPIGIAIGVVAALAAGMVYLAGSADRAKNAYLDQARATQQLTNSLSPLLTRYDELKANTQRTAAEQDELKKVVEQIVQIMPSATSAIDANGKAMDINAGKTREYVQAQQELNKSLAVKSLGDQQQKLKELTYEYEFFQKQQENFNKTGQFKTAIGISYKPSTSELQSFQVTLAQTNLALQAQRDLVAQTQRDAGQLVTTYASVADVVDTSLSNALAGVGGNIAATIQTLEQLKKKRDDLVTKRDTSDDLGSSTYNQDSAEIKRLNELIAKYEQLGKVGKQRVDELAKAFADAAQKIHAIDVRVNLGTESQYDAALDKIKEIQAGIDNATDKGAKVNDPRLQNLKNQLIQAQASFQAMVASFKFKPVEIPVNLSDFDTKEIQKIQQQLSKAKLTARLEFEYDNDQAKLDKAIADATEQARQQLAAAQVSVKNPVVQQVAGEAKVTQIQAFDSSSLKEYDALLQDIGDKVGIIGHGYDGIGEKVNAVGQRLQDLAAIQRQAAAEIQRLESQKSSVQADQTLDPSKLDENAAKLRLINELLTKYHTIAGQAGAASKNLAVDFAELKRQADWSNVTNSIESGLESLVNQAAGAVGDAIAGLISGTESGQDALNGLFKGVLKAIGDFLSQIGAALIAYGIAMDAFKKAFTNPYVAIAAGAALVVIGGILGSIASKGPAAHASSAGSSPASSASSAGSAYNQTKNNQINVQVTFKPVELRADGPQLRAALVMDTYRLTNFH